MPKSATDVMQDAIFSAVVDAFVALRGHAKGVPNALLRDLNAIHANTTPGDLPKEVQDAITASVRAAFDRMRREGYTMSAGSPAAPPRPRPPGPPRASGTGGGPPRPRGPRR